MKPVKNFLFAMLLVSVMAVSAIAGVQDTPGKVEEPPPSPPRQMTTITESDTEDAGGTTEDMADYLFFEVLTALLSVY